MTIPCQPIHAAADPSRALVFGRLQSLLALLGKLGGSSLDPTTPSGLRGAIGLIAELSQLIGVDPNWVDRLTGLFDDPDAFNLALAAAQFLGSLLAPSATAPSAPSTVAAPGA